MISKIIILSDSFLKQALQILGYTVDTLTDRGYITLISS